MVSNRNRWNVLLVGLLLGLVGAVGPSQQLFASGTSAENVSRAAERTGAPGIQKSLRLPEGQLLLVSSSGAELQLQRSVGSQVSRRWSLPQVRRNPSLTIMPDGRVLIWGGRDGQGKLQQDGVWFDPQLRVIEPALGLPMSARSGHTATVLTDGRVLFAGGDGEGRGYEVWSPDMGQLVQPEGAAPRSGHRAVLRADGQVDLFNGGAGSVGSRADMLFDPASNKVVVRAPEPVSRSSSEGLAGALPMQGAKDVNVDARLALRFTEPARLDDLNDANITLFGPGGTTRAHIVAAEGGRLVFVKPARSLFPNAPYTLMVDGVRTQQGRALPLMMVDFTTVALSPDAAAQGASADASKTVQSQVNVRYCGGRARVPQPCARASSMHEGVWTPGQDNLGDHWRMLGRQPELSYLGFMPAFYKALGKTALAGTVLRTDGVPVAGVAVSVGSNSARTNQSGQFLLYDVPAGRQRVYVDGTTANSAGYEYGQFIAGVDVKEGELTQVPFTMWLPRITERDKIKISSPSAKDLTLTHPDLPGMELHLPAGTVIRDQKGKIVTEVAIVPTPINRSPYPLPTNFSMYFTLQPGGAVLQGLTPKAGRGATVHYPNYDRHPEGTRADFWLYDAMEGWRVYGQGRVNKEETQFVPEPGVALHEVVSFGAAVSPNDPAPEEGMPPDPQECGECNAGTGSNATAGDPIDLRTGRFTYQETDISIADVMPLILGRNYRPSDSVKREFGIGTGAGFNYRIARKNTYAQMQLVLPNGTPLVFQQTSGSEAYGTWRYNGKHGFSGAVLASENEGGWKYRLKLRDGSQMTFEQYSPNRIKTVQDRFGNTIEYQYDAGRVSRIVSPHGRHIDLNYDAQNRIISAVDPLGTTWRYEYNALGMLAKVIYPDNTFRRYGYKTYGKAPVQQHLLNEIYDQRGNRLLFNEYQETDLIGTGVITTGEVVRQTLADGAVYGIQYDHFDGTNNGTLVTHPDGSQRRVVFNGGLYPASDTLAYGTSLAQEYKFERDADGRMLARIDPLGRRTEYQYDGEGQLVRTIRLAGSPDAVESRATFSAEGRVTSLTDPLGRVTHFEYDRGCLSKVTNPLGHSSTFGCNSSGQLETLTDALSNTSFAYYVGADLAATRDPLGRGTTYRHDALGRVIASEGPNGELVRSEYDPQGRMVRAVMAAGEVVELAYDPNGNLTDVLLPHNGGLSYDFDNRNRMIKRTDGLGQVETWAYDVMSRPTRYTDRRGFTTHYEYDALGRHILITYHDGTTVASTYDAGNRRLSLNDSASGVLAWGYDGLDRIVRVVSAQGEVNYGYDLVGRRTSMVADNQPEMRYIYDDGDRLIGQRQLGEVVEYTYDSVNRRTSMTLPNQVRAGYAYNEGSQLTGLAWSRGGQALGNLGYAYDNRGLVVSQTGTFSSKSLPSASIGENSFDDNQRQTRYNGQALTYDANGNLLTYEGRVLEWNSRNELVRVSESGEVVAEYKYDGLGRRVTKAEKGVVTSYLYDGLTAVQETRGGARNPVFTGLGVDERFARNAGGERAYFLTDHLGSTIALSSASGDLLVAYDADPYGGSSSTQGYDNPYRYTGRELDENGLYYYRARYYHSGMGRFISEDPIGLRGGVNMYAYVSGNPVSAIDPLGLRNVHKTAVAVGNAVNAGRLFSVGTLRVAAGLGLEGTGVGAPAGSATLGLGVWNLTSGQKAWARAQQQWAEAACEDSSNYTRGEVLKTYSGLLPWGTETDDPNEPFWIEVLEQRIRDARRSPWEFIQEVGTMGL
ncbi:MULTISPECIES: RHS repeat-associated core domain-containing protein [unclassified Stenotrophomonas]|uniref:RHS repeat-associated core domain-containing protein n=1 Tax=unclassified Stenotrophomonas TaxID=196198 RepID=UPI0015E690E7|nr:MULTISPECIES: RHS repeat-associated core domain-containing protein [unclassified Stenotrophomonas]